jgi:hypothetical protein
MCASANIMIGGRVRTYNLRQHAESHVNVQTAGVRIAARLTEDPNVSDHLVIQAGGSHLGDAEIREFLLLPTRALSC